MPNLARTLRLDAALVHSVVYPSLQGTLWRCYAHQLPIWAVQAQRAETQAKTALSDCQRKLAAAQVHSVPVACYLIRARWTQ